MVINKKEMALLESVLLLWAIGLCNKKRKVSEVLGTSVDTINKYIDSLEDYFGVKLLSTNGKGCYLTETGHKIVNKSDKIKEALDDIHSIRNANTEIKGTVRVFISLGYASYIVPQDLSSFFDAYPELTIRSVTEFNLSSLDSNEIDIIVTYDELDSDDMVLLSEKQIHCGFFATSKYLAQNGYPIDIDDLVNNFRLVAKRDGLLQRVLSEEQMQKAKICFTTNNTLALINAIENNTGAGILPLSFALQGLVCIDNITCNCPINYRLYANRHTKDIPRVRTLINFYKEIMDKLENPIPAPATKDIPTKIVRFRSGKYDEHSA